MAQKSILSFFGGGAKKKSTNNNELIKPEKVVLSPKKKGDLEAVKREGES